MGGIPGVSEAGYNIVAGRDWARGPPASLASSPRLAARALAPAHLLLQKLSVELGTASGKAVCSQGANECLIFTMAFGEDGTSLCLHKGSSPSLPRQEI